MTTGKSEGSGGTSLGNAGAAAGAEGGKSADVGTDGATGTQTSEQKGGASAGAAGESAEQKAAGEKAAAEKTALELAGKPFTELAQLKLPDGLKVDEAAMKDFLPLAQKHGLTAGQAAALVEFNAGLAKRAEEARGAVQDEAAKSALESLKKDAEIGGAKFEASMKLAGAALVKFGGPVDEKTGKSALVEAFNTTRLADGSMLGDQSWLAQFLVNVGKAIAEDQVGANQGGGAPKNAANDPATFNAEMYPNSPELHAKR